MAAAGVSPHKREGNFGSRALLSRHDRIRHKPQDRKNIRNAFVHAILQPSRSILTAYWPAQNDGYLHVRCTDIPKMALALGLGCFA